MRSPKIAAMACAVLTANAAQAGPVNVSPDGATSVPAMEVPSTPLMSREGNASRVEHIMTERGLSGRSVAEVNAALFGPRLAAMKAAYPVKISDAVIGGVPVRIYEPAGGSRKAPLLINVHGGGFMGCFTECGGLESIPVAALSGLKVISIDYRLAPKAQFPEASQDVEAVYREVLKTTPAARVGLYGCSAGGLLTAQSLAWFQKQGLPAPGAAGVFCAGGDASMAGDSRIFGMLLGD
ncbi:MAG: alpha/beta hydrolase, partial [Phenylobacterium zucineum]